MATYEELVMKIATGEKLNPLDLEEFRQKARSMDTVFNAFAKTIRPDGRLYIGDFGARSIITDIPVNRGITYTVVTNSPISSGSAVDLEFSDTRGYIKESDACVIRKPGTTSRFIRNPIIPQNRTILMLAEIRWGAHAIANTYHELSIDFYEDGVYRASASAKMASSLGYLTNFIYTTSGILDNEEVALSAYQDSGSDLALFSANLSFMLF